MGTVTIVLLAVIAYAALTQLAPARIAARIGFWSSVAAVGIWALDALDAALDHRWLSLSWNLLWVTICSIGAWAWADDVRRARADTRVKP